MISVILPVYNSENSLNKCIDSILNQSFSDFELLIINDGSTDSSEEIIKEYKDNRIRYFKQHNSGVSSARNIGIRNSSGDYLFFIDSDDEIDCNLFKELMSYALNYDSEIVLADIKSLNNHNYGYQITDLSFNINNSEELIEHFDDIAAYMCVGKLIRKSIIDEFNILFDENIFSAEDFIFVCKILAKTFKVSKTDKSFYLVNNINSLSLSKIYDPNIEFSIEKQLEVFCELNKLYPGIEFAYAINDMDFKLHKVKYFADNLFKKNSNISFTKADHLLKEFIKINSYLFRNNFSVFYLKHRSRMLESVIIKTKNSFIICLFYCLKHKLFKKLYL